MIMKKKIIKLASLSITEVSTITRLIGETIENCAKRAEMNSNGSYSHIVIRCINKFKKEDIDIIKKFFKKKYGSELMFESHLEGNLYVGYFSKLA